VSTRKLEKRVEKLGKRITRYQVQIDKAKACFTQLLTEPAALQARVDDAKKRIDDLNTELAGDPATLDPKKAYVEALVVRRLLQQVWGGFPRSPDFIDCLCRALTVWTQGCGAVSALTGCLAVNTCILGTREQRCTQLRTDTVDEILLAYDRICPEGDDCGDSGRHPHECECEECRHRRQRRGGCGCGCDDSDDSDDAYDGDDGGDDGGDGDDGDDEDGDEDGGDEDDGDEDDGDDDCGCGHHHHHDRHAGEGRTSQRSNRASKEKRRGCRR